MRYLMVRTTLPIHGHKKCTLKACPLSVTLHNIDGGVIDGEISAVTERSYYAANL